MILNMIWSTSNLESSLILLFLLHIPNPSSKWFPGKPFGPYPKCIWNNNTSYTSTEVTLVTSPTWITKIPSQLVFLLPSVPTVDFSITTEKMLSTLNISSCHASGRKVSSFIMTWKIPHDLFLDYFSNLMSLISYFFILL